MRLLRCLCSIFLILQFPALALPQQTAPAPQRDSQALVVLAQALAILSPAGAGVQDAVIQGQYISDNGTTGTITYKVKGPFLMRNELNLGGVQQVMVVNQNQAYSLRDGQKEKLPIWTFRYRRPELIAPFSRLADYAQPNTNVVYVGLEPVSDRPTHHIRLSTLPTDQTPPELEDLISEFHVFIDAQTGLIVKTITYDFSPQIMNNRTAVETYYDNYLPAGGLLVPTHITRYIYGQKTCEITLTSVQTNVGLSDSDFQ